MSSSPGAFDLPKRQTLSAQAAAAIRKAVEQNAWEEFLPSERRLCEIFQVSRPTIRTALHLLAREGLIEIHQGRRNRLPPPERRGAAPQSRLVVWVSHEPISQTTAMPYQGINDMRAQLAEHGFTTEVRVCAARGPAAQQRKLEAFVRENRVFCCVLVSVSRELQEWCAARAIPALVLGSCHPSVTLPSLDVDYRAVCRHAAGVLRAKGHRRMALVVPNSGAAGDLVSEQGFREGAAARPGGSAMDCRIVRHNGTAAQLALKLDALFADSAPPTALLVAKPQHMLFVMAWLLRRGIKVPETISLIARDHHPLFDGVIAQYRFEPETFAHHLSRLMLQLVSHGRLPPAPTLIFPQYAPAATVQSPRG